MNSWDDYMKVKRNKLKNQFVNESSKNSVKCEIFKGVSVFVNGYTSPSADDLKRLLIDYGGIYHHYFEKDRTTFMVASTLPAAKTNTMRNYKVIKPEWIVESIRAGKMLNYKEYLLLSDANYSQFTRQCSTVFENAMDRRVSVENQDSTTDNNCLVPLEETSTSLHHSNTHSTTKTARDDNFIEEFYSNSRLHHLSSMGVKLKEFVNKLRSEKVHFYSGRERLNKRKLPQPHDDGPNDGSVVLNEGEKCIMHIDMDCFFASVGIRNRPELKDLPVAVSHAKKEATISNQHPSAESFLKQKGVDMFDSKSEIACCNYKARNFGIKNGMLVGHALKLCPQLTIIPYEFRAYEEISYILYKHVASYTLDIEAVSCDEMFVDCTEILKISNVDVSIFATILRNEILEMTGCTCTTGFGPNRLVSRLATKIAKPNGQLNIASNDVRDFIRTIPVSYLPGVGDAIARKLRGMGIETCEDMQKSDVSKLQKEFGKKMGYILHKRCHGEDDRPLNFTHQRKSLSVDVNYGIRFLTQQHVEIFFKKLSLEIVSRLKNERLRGRSVTLKLMVKAKHAPNESAKFLGHGICDIITKTVSLNEPTSNADVIYRIVMKITRDMEISPQVIRGVGIQVSRLENESIDKPAQTIAKFVVKKPNQTQTCSNFEHHHRNQGEMKNNVCSEVSSSSDVRLINVRNYENRLSSNRELQNIIKYEYSGIAGPIDNAQRSLPKSEMLYLGSFMNFDTTYSKFSKCAPLPEIVRSIESWILEDDDPQLSDVEILFSFMRSLACKNDFESLNFVADNFRR